jgi:alginate O-acetyltransferase complex protein AlgI
VLIVPNKASVCFEHLGRSGRRFHPVYPEVLDAVAGEVQVRDPMLHRGDLRKMLGFVFPPNFDSPYKSQSITEFWRRWHISLSTWLRDYLHIPLGGNRYGPSRTYVNLALTMLLGGLWHGAAWTFIAWGAYQGFWLAFERMLGKRPLYSKAPRPLRILLTFIIVLGGWVFFRATSFEQAFHFLRAMAGFGEGAAFSIRFEVGRLDVFILVACAVIVWLRRNTLALVNDAHWRERIAVALLFPLAVCYLVFASYSPFLYFQF